MKGRNRLCMLAMAAMLLLGMGACSKADQPEDVEEPSVGEIYLYGERHGVGAILEREFEIWQDHYHNEGMRHLFVEQAYYTAEFLNIWMESDNDDILNEVYADGAGTAGHVPEAKAFYKRIKAECPETIFHGTDVGHQYESTGKRFLEYLQENGLEDTQQYSLAQEAIEQGTYFYGKPDRWAYRENQMTKNFIREFGLLDGESVMGIYGSMHTGLEEMDFYGTVPCMANQLRTHYGDVIQSTDLTGIPLRVDSIDVNGIHYEASYFGEDDLTGFKDFVCRAYWRLENAYPDFKDNPKTGDYLPYNNYPMKIEIGQVFVIDYTKTDGSVMRMYYCSQGDEWEGLPTTVNVTVD